MNRKQIRRLYRNRTVTDPDTGRERTVVDYVGRYFHSEWEASRVRKSKGLLVLWLMITLAAYVIAACLNSPSSRCMYVLPLFLFCLFPLFYEAMGLARLLTRKGRITEADQIDGTQRLTRSSMGVVVLMAACSVADIVFLLLNGAADTRLLEIGFLCLCLLASAASFMAFCEVKAYAASLKEDNI